MKSSAATLNNRSSFLGEVVSDHSVPYHDAQTGKPCGTLTAAQCLRLEADGMGRAVRNQGGRVVRFLFGEITGVDTLLSARGWQGGSHTTRRMKDAAGVIFSAPWIREHKPAV